MPDPKEKPYPKGWIKRELGFQNWWDKVWKHLYIHFNPDKHYYDYRSFYEKEPLERVQVLATPKGGGVGFHFPDTYKQPGHPTFSTESMYHSPETPGGRWKQNGAGQWEFHHSPYTYKYNDRTLEYLEVEDPSTPVYYKGIQLNGPGLSNPVLDAAKAPIKFKKIGKK